MNQLVKGDYREQLLESIKDIDTTSDWNYEEGSTTKIIEEQKVYFWIRVFLKEEDNNIQAGDNITIKYTPSGETLTTQFIADGTLSTYTLDFVASSINEFEVFVGGKRLRKNAISSYVSLNPTYQDSPEGDVTLPAEFSVNGSTLTLTTTPTANVKVTVVRRSGIIWTNPGTQLSKADSDIARFLRDSTVDLPR